MSTHGLLMAKAPIPGRAKTRLGRVVGMEVAADLAAAALLDSIEACSLAFANCRLALDGDLGAAVRGEEIAGALESWQVFDQRGANFSDRLADAHQRAAGPGTVVVQIGMDTPQVTPVQLRAVAALVRDDDDAVLGPAVDGGWWALGMARRDGARALATVAMSTSLTRADTRAALAGAGLIVREAATLRDVDTVADADAVAAAAPGTRFARAWLALGVAA